LQSIGIDPEPGVQCIIIPVSAYPEEGFRRSQGHPAGEEIELHPRCLDEKGGRCSNRRAQPYDLVVKLLYGCGLRLFECLKLRVQNFNFDEEVLTVMDGKGKKARTVPIPQSIMQELLAQLEAVKRLHDEDLKAGYTGVFLDDALDKKYRNASKDFIWQWFFPQQNLTFLQEQKELRRYHLSDKEVQRSCTRRFEKQDSRSV
jgi:integrase